MPSPVKTSGPRWWSRLVAASPSCRMHACRVHHRTGPWSKPPERLPTNKLVVIERGRLWVHANRRRFLVNAGEALLFAAGTTIAYKHTGDATVLVQHNCRFAARDADGPITWRPSVDHRVDAWELLPVLRLLRDRWQRSTTHAGDAQRAGLVMALAGFRDLPSAGGTTERRLRPEQRARIAAVVDERLTEGLDAGELAAAVGLSLDYFTRCFAATYGMPPKRWLVHERMRLAAEWLHERPDPVHAIAAACGVHHIGLFNRQFKLVMGCTPTAWRHTAHD